MGWVLIAWTLNLPSQTTGTESDGDFKKNSIY